MKQGEGLLKLNRLITKLRGDDDRHKLKEGVREEKISELEEIIGERLPEDYREFLKISNGAEINYGNMVIYGIYLGNNEDRDEYDNYVDFKLIEEFHEFGFPEGFLSIGEVGNGDELMVNMKSESKEVVYFYHEISWYEKEWESFTEWLEEELNEWDIEEGELK